MTNPTPTSTTTPPRRTTTTTVIPQSSRAPIIVMSTVITITACSIYYSHYQQVRDKAVMREGVMRDKERLRVNKARRGEEEKDR